MAVPSVGVFADQASPGNLPYYQKLKAAGYQFVERYIAPDGAAFDFKRLTRPEADCVVAAGMGYGLNFETSKYMAHLAPNIAKEYAKIGWDLKNTTFHDAGERLYYSDDVNSTYDQVAPFFEACASIIPVPNLGYYGDQRVGLRLMDAGVVSGVWVSAAAYQSGFSNWKSLRANLDPRVHGIQWVDKPLGFASTIDHNEIIRADFLGGDVALAPDERNWLQAVYMLVTADHGFLDWFQKVIKGDPEANKVPNFLTDLHAIWGVEKPILEQILSAVQAVAQTGSPNAPTDISALAAALGPILAAQLNKDEGAVLIDALKAQFSK